MYTPEGKKLHLKTFSNLDCAFVWIFYFYTQKHNVPLIVELCIMQHH